MSKQNINIEVDEVEKVTVLVVRNKTIDRVALSILGICLVGSIPFFIGTSVIASDVSNHVACSQFSTWQAAQDAFEANPTKYKSLDGDHDGIACEVLEKH